MLAISEYCYTQQKIYIRNPSELTQFPPFHYPHPHPNPLTPLLPHTTLTHSSTKWQTVLTQLTHTCCCKSYILVIYKQRKELQNLERFNKIPSFMFDNLFQALHRATGVHGLTTWHFLVQLDPFASKLTHCTLSPFLYIEQIPRTGWTVYTQYYLSSTIVAQTMSKRDCKRLQISC